VGAPGAAPGDGLTVTVCRPAPGVGVVRAVGEIDVANALRWGRVLADLGHDLAHHDDAPRRGGGRGRLVCDLTGVEFFGAAGMGVLAQTAALAASAGVGLRIVADSHPVLRPITALGLDRQLCIDAHLVSAITHAVRRRR